MHFVDQRASVKVSYSAENSVLQALKFQELTIWHMLPGGQFTANHLKVK
jgi:hypothetical protein